MEKYNRLSSAILIGAIILGGFYFYSEKNKQESIERQQRLEMSAKKESENKKYVADQKSNCLGVYETENKKWNNVNSWRYDETDDTCYIEYKTSPRLTEAECDKAYRGKDGTVAVYYAQAYFLCKDGLHEKSF